MGIASPSAKPVAEKQPDLGKKEALEVAANNPIPETKMSKLLAMRLPVKKADG